MIKIHTVFLAAGSSSRFGGNKLLHSISGKPMYRYVTDSFEAVRSGICGMKCIVSQYDEILIEMEKKEYICIRNEMPESGISRSVSMGIQALLDQGMGEGDAVMFCVCDQPYLQTETFSKFLGHFQSCGKGIACIRTEGRTGNPVIFSHKYLRELMQLTGDQGGKKLLLRHLEDVSYFVISSEKELEDIDVREKLPAAAENFLRMHYARYENREWKHYNNLTDLLQKAVGEQGKSFPQYISIVGAGGKTSTAYHLANELCMQGRTVIVTTTTHMREPDGLYEWTGLLGELSAIEEQLSKKRFLTVGRRCEGHKITGIPEESLQDLGKAADHVIIEADGSKGLPAKAPAAHEPAIPQMSGLVISILAYPAVGETIADAAHRPQKMAELLKTDLTHRLTADDLHKVFYEEDGLKKGARSAYVPILNRCRQEFLESPEADRYKDGTVICFYTEEVWK